VLESQKWALYTCKEYRKLDRGYGRGKISKKILA
jgi:hypothetical protein